MDSRFLIGIDFDGTIAKHRFPKIGAPVPGAFEWTRKFREAGAELMLWTIRCKDGSMGDVLTPAIQFCNDNGLFFYGVNENPQQVADGWSTSPKMYCHSYIDDAAAGTPLILEVGELAYVNWSLVGPHVLAMMESHRQFGRIKHAPEGYGISLAPQVELPERKLVQL